MQKIKLEITTIIRIALIIIKIILATIMNLKKTNIIYLIRKILMKEIIIILRKFIIEIIFLKSFPKIQIIIGLSIRKMKNIQMKKKHKAIIKKIKKIDITIILLILIMINIIKIIKAILIPTKILMNI